jgi:hemolysin III
MPDNTRARRWLEEHITLHSYDSPREEFASGLVHAAGAAASLLALVLLTAKGLAAGAPGQAAGLAIYGAAMLLLYLSSSLYHFVPVSNLKRVLRICDHMSIYLLIAGTYTPVMITVGGFWGHFTVALVWGIAAAGMAFKIAFWGRYRLLQVLIYILMGWLIVLVKDQVIAALSREFFLWALAGGVVYTSGTLVYAMKKMPYYHALWHLFVVGGSVCFFVAIYWHL